MNAKIRIEIARKQNMCEKIDNLTEGTSEFLNMSGAGRNQKCIRLIEPAWNHLQSIEIRFCPKADNLR